ncbi:MAG TPA: tetratricopeptide repeat protein [Bacteroidia bacterium]|jgi:tetratricopeptide (TPR) repeat protein
MKRLLLLPLIFLSQFAFGQQSKIDSLINLLKTDKADTTKLIHLYKISDECETIGNYPDGIKFGNQAILFADVLIQSNADKTIQQVAKKYKAKAFGNIGIIYTDQGNYPEALKNHFASLKIKEAIGDKKGISNSYNNIGIVYYCQGNYPEALKNHFACLKIYEAIGDKKGISNSYNNIGLVYNNQGNYPEALKNHFASLKIEEAIGDKKEIANTYNNIGGVYYNQGNYPEALKNYFACLKIKEEIGDKHGIATSYTNIGETNLKLNKIAESRQYLKDALSLSKEIGAKDLIRNSYSGLAQVDSIIGNYKSQIANYKMHILYRDSLDNEETRKKTIQSQMQYEYETKEAVANAEHKKELENQEAIAVEKNRKQKLVTAFVIGCLLLVLVFAGFVFRSLRITRKQKALIEMQKIIVEQHQKDIVDSIHYARRIQTALLPTEKYIEKNINRLKKG